MNTFQIMARLGDQARSRAASSKSKEDVTITEITDGLIVSKPAKKIEYLSTGETKEPVVIDLQKSKAGSVQGNNINKLKVIQDFINHRH